METDIKALKPFDNPLDKFDIGERYVILDTICCMARDRGKKSSKSTLDSLIEQGNRI